MVPRTFRTFRAQIFHDDLRRVINLMAAQSGIGGGFALQRQNIEPPMHHSLAFAEEAMSADVDAVSLVIERLRDTADGIGRLAHDRMDIGACEEFVGGGEAGGARSRDDGYFLAHKRRVSDVTSVNFCEMGA